MRIDQVMLGVLLGSREVGLYSVAAKLSEFWNFIPMAIGSSLFPAIVLSQARNTEKAHRLRIQLFFDATMLVAYVLVVPLCVFAPLLVRFLYGSAYAPGGQMFRILILALLFTSLGVARGKWLVAENLTKIYMMTVILGAVTNISLNCWLIPSFGGVGAAWATVVSYMVAAYGSCFLFKKTRGLVAMLTLALLIPFRLPAFFRSLRAADIIKGEQQD